MHESQHHALQFGFSHLAVAYADAGLGHELLNLAADLVDRFHAVMDEIDLAAALQLQLDRRAYQLFVELRHHGLDRHAIFRRRLDHAHIAQPDQRHVQRARNRRRRHGKHIDLAPHLLQPLFVANAETLFFVHD